VAGPKQPLANMRTNEAGAAGDEEVHPDRLSDKYPAVEGPEKAAWGIE
jgi:hypothetical protein